MQRIYIFIIFLFVTCVVVGQEEYSSNSKTFIIPVATTINVNEVQDDWMPNLQNLGSPLEGNNQYRIYLNEIKKEVSKKYPRKSFKNNQYKDLIYAADTLIVLKNFEANKYANSVPNDNTLAISNDNFLISSINTNIYFYDLNEDSLKKTISLSAFSDTLSNVSTHQYDPKLLYDPTLDRFIVVYLAGSSANTTTDIIIGFSQTSDALGDWNFYSLPGNPISNDTSWTDYPAITVTEDELFITGNLLKYGGSWQTSFKQSVIWQVDKMKGYAGDSLETRLWYDIKHNGHNIRNIHPVKGGDFPVGPDIYLLSNRNFDIQNDSIFLIHISGIMSDPSTQITIKPVIADKSYGMPPDARQDHSYFFATNDARILGAFIQNNQIQFVSNTIDTITGFAALYHGVLTWHNGDPQIHGNILSDTAFDYGYPNISYSGNSSTDNQSIITFDHSSPETNGGFSGIFYKGLDEYSKRIIIKEGEYWVHIISGLVERWGDYTGSQRKYDEPGKVWVSGNFSKLTIIGTIQIKKGVNGTWISEIQSPYVETPEPPASELITFTYPNPASYYLTVEFNLLEDKVLEISVFDINGKKVKKLLNGEVQKGPNNFSFSTVPLSRGIYFLTIMDDNNIIRTEKFVVGE